MRSCPLGMIIAAILLGLASGACRGDAPVPENSPYNLPGHGPFLMAHYMDWFSLETPRAGIAWNHWKWDGTHPHDPTHRLPNGNRDVASVLYPLIGPYDITLPEVVRYHLATMHAAGISGVIIDWYGQGTFSDVCLPVILDEANKLGMRVALCYEEKTASSHSITTRAQMMDNAVRQLSYLVTQWAPHPAYLRRDGRPWIMQFNSYGRGSLGSKSFSPAEDQAIFARLPSPIAFCRQDLNPSYSPAVAGGYLWAPETTQGDLPEKFGLNAANLRQQGHLQFFMSRLCVGFNDSGVWGWGKKPRISPSYGLEVLQHAESQALAGDPELIQCITWNDFNEGTCFEPTVQYGFSWLDEVAKFVGKLRNQAVDLKAIRAPYEEYVRSCTPAEKLELPVVAPSLLEPR